MLKDAALLLKRYPPKSKRSWGFAVIQILSSVAILIAGGLFDLDKLQQDTNWLFIFLVVLSTAITLTVVEIVLGRTQ